MIEAGSLIAERAEIRPTLDACGQVSATTDLPPVEPETRSRPINWSDGTEAQAAYRTGATTTTTLPNTLVTRSETPSAPVLTADDHANDSGPSIDDTLELLACDECQRAQKVEARVHNLRVDTPTGVLSDEQREELVRFKPEILSHLQKEAAQIREREAEKLLCTGCGRYALSHSGMGCFWCRKKDKQ